MTFNIAQFSKDSKESGSSLVKEYEISENYRLTTQDIDAAKDDATFVIRLTIGVTTPPMIIMWLYLPVPLLVVLLIIITIIAIITMTRYLNITGSAISQSGHISWENLKNEATSKGKAEIRYIRTDWRHEPDGNGQYITRNNGEELTHILKSDVVNPQQLEAIATAVLSTGKFNQDTVCKAANLATNKYTDLANEMIAQRLITLKGKSLQQGVTLSKQGYELFGQLAAPTPLPGTITAISA